MLTVSARGEQTCRDCGFNWSIDIPEAIGLVAGAPDRYRALLDAGLVVCSGDHEDWSAVGYLWHVVDVIRFGTERLWVLALDPASGVPGWEQEALARERHYEALSPVVGLRALDHAVRDWIEAACEAPADAEVEHAALGRLTTEDSIRRNAHEIQHHERDVRLRLGLE